MKLLLTGGLGYVGSHTALALLAAGHRVVLLDDLSNSHPETAGRIERLAGVAPIVEIGDVRDAAFLDRVFRQHRFDAVLHFAARKSVPESMRDPIGYFDVNVTGTLRLLEAMVRHDVRHLIFSSSAAVYGDVAAAELIDEACPPRPQSPYAVSKLVSEQLIAETARLQPGWRAILLRYFNPAGAHPSGELGEDALAPEQTLMHACCRAALGRASAVAVFGTDYPTRDGSAVRDFLHVMDVAEGHVAAVHALDRLPTQRTEIVNLGTGRGSTVLEVIACMGAVVGKPLKVTSAARREGDIMQSIAAVDRAARLLGWRARHGLDAMCRDALRWEASRA